MSTIDAIGLNAQVIPVFQNKYSYADSDSGSVTSIEQLQHINGSWKNIKVVTLAHDSSGTLLEARKMAVRDGKMQLVETLDYSFDERGRLSGREWSFLGEDGWASPFKAEFEVFDDSTVIVNTQTFGGESSVSGKSVIQFDGHNNVTSSTVFRWMNDAFVPGRREVYSYVQAE
ncbi:MAG: hypothetical protein HKN43_08245 [Rhodothermales bacterium]|nr:hypothetical protein [Rhodothermales bacterium]